MEDLVAAGAIIKRIKGRLSPESIAAIAAFDAVKEHLRDHLMQCSSGRELAEKRYIHDVELAADLDVSDAVPLLIDDAFVSKKKDAEF